MDQPGCSSWNVNVTTEDATKRENFLVKERARSKAGYKCTKRRKFTQSKKSYVKSPIKLEQSKQASKRRYADPMIGPIIL